MNMIKLYLVIHEWDCYEYFALENIQLQFEWSKLLILKMQFWFWFLLFQQQIEKKNLFYVSELNKAFVCRIRY